eukprot:m.83223 g.83223  ORF g.83223 m.83223 type:complete len:80 (-) comp19613_c0_seq1:352-591(-)
MRSRMNQTAHQSSPQGVLAALTKLVACPLVRAMAEPGATGVPSSRIRSRVQDETATYAMLLCQPKPTSDHFVHDTFGMS